MNASIFPELKTERLLLRKLETTDAETIYFLRSDATVNEFIKRTPAKNIDEGLQFIEKVNSGFFKNENVNWGISTEGKLVGTICLWNFSENKKTAEIGYDLHSEFQGKGITTEAVQKVLFFGFEKMKFEEIEAFTDHKNTNSIKLLTSNGFTLLPDRKDEGNADNVIYRILKSDKTEF